MDILRSAVIPSLSLEVGEHTYTVEFPLSAVIQAEAELGRSLKTAGDWFAAEAKDVPALLKAGLSRHHPDITEEEINSIFDRLNPEGVEEVIQALAALAFPKFIERFKARLEQLQEGKSDTKAQSADAL